MGNTEIPAIGVYKDVTIRYNLLNNWHDFKKTVSLVKKYDMIVERINNELLVRIPGNMTSSRIQSIMDYLRYEELTADSTATQSDVDDLVAEAKKGRWERIKKEIGF